MKTLNYEDARSMLLFCADAVIESKPLLTEIDSKIGDGDHGIGMACGMTKLKEKLEAMAGCRDVYKLFSEAGKAMLMSMGGASGVIFGTMLMGGAKGKTAESISAAEFAQMMGESLAAIKQRGKAEPGDKTMVDALEPAVKAMREYAGDDFAQMLHLAENAAAQGVESTKDLIAKFGRSKFLGERAIGYQDAGATSVWIIFKAMKQYTEGLSA